MLCIFNRSISSYLESSIALLVPSTSSITPMMSETQYARASEWVHNSIMIKPTKSIPVQLMTSIVSCDTTIKEVELELRFEGELNEVNLIDFFVFK